MKHYYSYVPISAKIHKKQNRMTLLCITLAVFLVTVIFSTVVVLCQYFGHSFCVNPSMLAAA